MPLGSPLQVAAILLEESVRAISPLHSRKLPGPSNIEGQAVADLDSKDGNFGKRALKTLMADPVNGAIVKHLMNDRCWEVAA